MMYKARTLLSKKKSHVAGTTCTFCFFVFSFLRTFFFSTTNDQLSIRRNCLHCIICAASKPTGWYRPSVAECEHS